MTTEERSELPAHDPNADAKRRALFIAAGIIFVSLSYPDTGIGRIPLRYVLKDEMHLGPLVMAAFFTLANIPSWCKPVLGIVSDSVPLFGTRRRSYVMLAAAIGCLLWAVMSVLPHEYGAFLAVAVALNAMATVGGTINGAVIIEEGQRQGATGRLASVRSICLSGASVVGGVLGGKLAERAFGLTCLAGGILMASLFVLAAFCLREPRTARRDTNAWASTRKELARLFRSGPLWAAGGLMFLVQVAPGFSTSLFYHQTNRLGFDPGFIGDLAGVSSACGAAAGVAYFFLCRRMDLRHLLFLGIATHALGAFAYVFYLSRPAAMLIDGFYGLTGALAFLALFDLTARATPKGSEALGYSILYAFINIAMGASDVIGSRLFEFYHQQFTPLVWINGGTTAVILLGLPFLPSVLVNRKDGERAS